MLQKQSPLSLPAPPLCSGSYMHRTQLLLPQPCKVPPVSQLGFSSLSSASLGIQICLWERWFSCSSGAFGGSRVLICYLCLFVSQMVTKDAIATSSPNRCTSHTGVRTRFAECFNIGRSLAQCKTYKNSSLHNNDNKESTKKLLDGSALCRCQ